MADTETPLVRSATPIATTCGMPVGRGTVVAATAFVFVSGMLAGQVTRAPTTRPPAARVDPCALPAGISMELLAPAERALVARRGLHCSDLVNGRVDRTGYRAAVALLDAGPLVLAPPPPPPAMIWGAQVRSMSSQYSAASWSAQRALGRPDVFPAAGDHVDAWASEGADDRVEFLEIGLERATRLSAVEVYETFNPGAVSQIELIGVSGARTVVHHEAPRASGTPSRIVEAGFECTSEPIVAVRVTIDSPAVAGWNEIDAIGAQPCE
jgi:hypothetical protein